MTTLNTTHFKKLARTDLYTLVDWAKEEGWNPGPYDADVFWQTDPDGYYGYYLDDKLIAGGSIVSYYGLFGFMGFFIVKSEFRNRGIGRKLWHQRKNMLLSRLKPGASIGMDGVIGMQSFYEKGGFRLAFIDERHCRLGERMEYNTNVIPISKTDKNKIIACDLKCFGVPRKKLLIPWFEMPESYGFCYKNGNDILGYSLLRKADIGYKIGPLFAENYDIAEQLYRACLNAAPNQKVFLDIPVANDKAIKLTQQYNTTNVFECVRMYHGSPPKYDITKVFGITSFELG